MRFVGMLCYYHLVEYSGLFPPAPASAVSDIKLLVSRGASVSLFHNEAGCPDGCLAFGYASELAAQKC